MAAARSVRAFSISPSPDQAQARWYRACEFSSSTSSTRADQLNPTTIMIASEFRVTSEFVEANRIGDVVDINAAIRKLNEGVLVVQKGRAGLH